MPAGLALLAAAWVMAVLVSSCVGDPGGELLVRIENRTDRTVRLTVPEVVVFRDDRTPAEKRDPPVAREMGLLLDETLAAGESKELRVHVPFGSEVGPARAYVQGNLVFCEQFPEFGHGPRGNNTIRWDLVIVEGPLDCQTPQPPPR